MSRQIFPSDKTPNLEGFTVTDPTDGADAGRLLLFELEGFDGKVSRSLQRAEVRDLIDRLNAWDTQR